MAKNNHMNDYEDNTAYNEEELPVSSNQITSHQTATKSLKVKID